MLIYKTMVVHLAVRSSNSLSARNLRKHLVINEVFSRLRNRVLTRFSGVLEYSPYLRLPQIPLKTVRTALRRTTTATI